MEVTNSFGVDRASVLIKLGGKLKHKQRRRLAGLRAQHYE